MEKQKDKPKTWMECQNIEIIKQIKTVNEIVYPDGSKGELKGSFFVL